MDDRAKNLDGAIQRISLLARLATKRPWRYDEHGDFIFGPREEMVASSWPESEGPDSLVMRGRGAKLPVEDNGKLVVEVMNNLEDLLFYATIGIREAGGG